MDLNREMGEVKTQIDFLTQDIKEIKNDVKLLISFRWRVAGFAGCVALIATLAVEFIDRLAR